MNENSRPGLSQKFTYNHGTYQNITKTSFSMHSHNCYELILFLKGDATHVVEDRKYKLSKNDLIIIRPSEYHYIQIDGNKEYERFNILISPENEDFKQAVQLVKEIEVINLSANPIALELFKKMDFYKTKLSEVEFERITILLLVELFYNLSIYRDQAKQHSAISLFLSEALNYINENLYTVENVEEIANKLYVTPSYLFRIFKKELKTTPKKYITDKRLLMAQTMISMGKSPTEVFTACGFNDYTAFYRSYTSFFGHSPSKDKT